LTPASAAKSNAAAREAGWYASTWHHAQFSEKARGKSGPLEWRKQIADMLCKHTELTTEQIRARLVLSRDTVRGRLGVMEAEGQITKRIELIDGVRKKVWRLAE
jgi:hypothetical protein